MNEIGKRISKARKDADMTQECVAEKLNVTPQAVSLWETDKTVPDMYNLIDLAKLLEVSVSSLVEDRGDYVFTTSKNIYDWKHMASFIKHTALAKGSASPSRRMTARPGKNRTFPTSIIRSTWHVTVSPWASTTTP